MACATPIFYISQKMAQYDLFLFNGNLILL